MDLSLLQDRFAERIASLFQLSSESASAAAAVLSCLILLVLAFIVDFGFRKLINSLVPKAINRLQSTSPKEWVTALSERLVVKRSAHLIGILFFYCLVPYAAKDFPEVLRVIQNGVEGYLVIIGTLAVSSFIRACKDVWEGTDLKIGVPVRFASQSLQVVVWVVGSLLAISVTFDKSVTVLLSGLAGMTAILALVFRDSILGFVAGIQLGGNDMIHIGDWIEVPQYGANGTVEEVGLTTVKVRNFDKTISTVPSYSLVSQSFKNWRGMEEFAARRIKRSISLDMNSIRFLSSSELEQLKGHEILAGFWSARNSMVANHQPSDMSNHDGKRLTNLSLFGDYISHYLNHHPQICRDRLVMVRQLVPGEHGLPVEVYCFCKDIQWSHYERVQWEIMDHILGILPQFDLKPFQLPTDFSFHGEA